jgi:hypothetical protein
LMQVIDGDLVKVMSWYDNEWGYSSQMAREAPTDRSRVRGTTYVKASGDNAQTETCL